MPWNIESSTRISGLITEAMMGSFDGPFLWKQFMPFCVTRGGEKLALWKSLLFFIESFLGPEAEAPPAQLVGLAGHPPHLGAAPVEGELAEAVDEALLLDHGQVALPLAASLVAAVVVTHRPRHLKARK